MSMEVSVVIATYNGEKYIKQQLESIINQSVKPDEIIICDDASSDNTTQICEHLLSESGIKFRLLCHKNNAGVIRSFCELMEAATCDVVFLCDQDDVWYPNKIARFLDAFEQNPNCKVVFSNADLVDKDLKRLGKSLWEDIGFAPKDLECNIALFNEMLHRNVFTGMSMAFNRSWYQELPPFSRYMLHDEFIGWCAVLHNSAEPLQECLAAYRQHDANVVGTGRHRKFETFRLMKKQVIISCERSKNKFYDLLGLNVDHLQEVSLTRAYAFYKDRASMLNSNMPMSFFMFVKIIVSNGYHLYCSKTDKALLKDTLCLFTVVKD